jgi:hypothetical protein
MEHLLEYDNFLNETNLANSDDLLSSFKIWRSKNPRNSFFEYKKFDKLEPFSSRPGRSWKFLDAVQKKMYNVGISIFDIEGDPNMLINVYHVKGEPLTEFQEIEKLAKQSLIKLKGSSITGSSTNRGFSVKVPKNGNYGAIYNFIIQCCDEICYNEYNIR